MRGIEKGDNTTMCFHTNRIEALGIVFHVGEGLDAPQVQFNTKTGVEYKIKV